MIRVRQIKIGINSKEKIEDKIINKLHIKNNELESYKIIKKSIDARNKNNIMYVYEVLVNVKNENKLINNKDVIKYTLEEYKVPKKGSKKIKGRVVVVGSGPAGLMSAYLLAYLGYNPLVIERGESVKRRVKKVEKFWSEGILEEDTNVQFGEGGAGTFSDGKLYTTHDKDSIVNFIFQIFVNNGANKEIMYESNPHIGTDKLRGMVESIRNNIIKMGAEFRFNTKLTDIKVENGELKSIILNDNEEIETNACILAIGHSARDTFEMLNRHNIEMMPKAFAVGVRIMHLQEDIDKSQYGESYKLLPRATYKLTHTTSKGRGVYSFCMCPGGYVVNASSEIGTTNINGMSNYLRNSTISNSAIIVTVTPKDFGSGVLDGVKFQLDLEHKAYLEGNKKIPIQKYIDYKNNKKSESIGKITPKVKGEYQLSNVRKILPEFINEAIIEGIEEFGKRVKCFNSEDALICGVETRTSSPIMIIRDENFNSSVRGLYPTGEGAGYAGGITTSGVDGIKVAESIIKMYNSN